MAFLLCCLVDAAFKARRLCAAGDIFPVVELKVSWEIAPFNFASSWPMNPFSSCVLSFQSTQRVNPRIPFLPEGIFCLTTHRFDPQIHASFFRLTSPLNPRMFLSTHPFYPRILSIHLLVWTSIPITYRAFWPKSPFNPRLLFEPLLYLNSWVLLPHGILCSPLRSDPRVLSIDVSFWPLNPRILLPPRTHLIDGYYSKSPFYGCPVSWFQTNVDIFPYLSIDSACCKQVDR